MIADMVREGVGAFVSGREVADRRCAIGVSDEAFLAALLAAALTSFAGYLVPELNGVGAAFNAVTGSSESSDLTLGVAVAVAGALAVILLVEWRPGPGMVSFLSHRFGASAGAERGRVWIYLTALATSALNLGILLVDSVLGVVALVSMAAAGWLSFLVTLLGLVAVVAVFASLAQDVLGLAGRLRSVVFVVAWIALLVVIAAAVVVPLYALFLGS